MSLEALKTISEAEEKARRARQEAIQADKRMIAEAEEDGRKAIDAAVKKAENELEELKKQAVAKARDEAVKLSGTTENRKAAMLVKAEARTEEAVKLVVERIVNS